MLNMTAQAWRKTKDTNCLLLLGSHIASAIDHLISGLRTPAIAESAIRSAGLALIAANEAKAKQSSQGFMRFFDGEATPTLLGQAIRETPLQSVNAE